MPRTPSSAAPRVHFVVDGSNIATEGRSQPNLQQLNEAVLAFLEDYPGALVTVVVDATFGHRIDKKEVKEFDLAVANNELVTPPAGAVGRGDAFVLSIAHKAKAGILSNDSFQEFHGKYEWLFEQGRLIGGKPVPHVGWVFVERSPVRGPKSRQSVKEAQRSDDGSAPAPTPAPARAPGRRSRRVGTASGSPLASEPLPLPATPPPGPARAPATVDSDAEVVVAAATAAQPARTTVNDLVPFLDFVEKHPVGTSCTAVVESYSSHGAYARSDLVLVYIPLRLMDDPPPRSARSRLQLGEAVTLVVVGYAPERRSVDAALPNMAPSVPVPAPDAQPAPKKPRRSAKAAAAAADAAPVVDAPAAEAVPAERSTPVAKRTSARGSRTPSTAAAPPTDATDAPPAKPGRRSRKALAPVVETPPAPEVASPAAETPTPSKARRSRKAAPVAPPEGAPPAKKPATKPARRAAKAVKAVAPPTVAPAAAKRGTSRRKPAATDPTAS